ncbi:MAG: hypothetical protein ACK5CY_05175 [Bacteroidia bacterium]
MKNLKITFFLVLSIVQLKAQSVFSRTYGAPEDFNQGVASAETPDGGYLLAGSTGGWGSVNGDMAIIKTDSLGNQQWVKLYGSANTEQAVSLLRLNDGSFLLAGNTNQNEGDYDALIYKINTLGDTLLSRRIGTPAWDFVKDVAEFPNGEIAVLLQSYASPFPNGGMLVILIDATGNETERFTLQANDKQTAGGIYAETDSTLMVCGGIWNEEENNSDMYVARFSKTGDLLWTDTVVTTFNETFNSICAGPNNSFLVCGTMINNDSISKGKLFRYDANGTPTNTFFSSDDPFRFDFRDVTYNPINQTVFLGTLYNGGGFEQATCYILTENFAYTGGLIGPGLFTTALGSVLNTDRYHVFCGTSEEFTPGQTSMFLKKCDAITGQCAEWQTGIADLKNSDVMPQIFPNPGNGTFFLQNAESYTIISALDMTGRPLPYTLTHSQGELKIERNGYSGLVLLSLQHRKTRSILALKIMMH